MGGLPLEIGQIRVFIYPYIVHVHLNCLAIKQYNFGLYYTLGPGVGNYAYPYTIMNAGFGLMWEQLQSIQPF